VFLHFMHKFKLEGRGGEGGREGSKVAVAPLYSIGGESRIRGMKSWEWGCFV